MRYLTVNEVLTLHRLIVAQSGGAIGLRDIGALESVVAQPRMTFGGTDLYPSLEQKAAALAFSLITDHPFIDGNKRTGHAAMETFLLLNGHQLEAVVDDAERLVLAVASGDVAREGLVEWIKERLVAS